MPPPTLSLPSVETSPEPPSSEPPEPDPLEPEPWCPEPPSSEPPEPEPELDDPPEVVASEVLLSPMTDTALPPTVTGASTETTPWLPPSRLSLPSVVTSPPEPDEPPVVVASEVWLSPITETALPPMATGASTETMPWLPPSRLYAPEVSTAFATPHPRTAKPLPTSAPMRTRVWILRMRVSPVDE